MKTNKIVTVLMLAALISIVVAGCTASEEKYSEEITTTAAYEGFEKVLPQVLDSGKGTCIIVLPYSLRGGRDKGMEAMIYLGKQKEKWLKKFPQKEIISWTAITHSYSSVRGVSLTTGILIHYQSKERGYL